MKKAAPFLFLIILFAVAAWYSFVKEPNEVHELPVQHLPPAKAEQPTEPVQASEDIEVYSEPEPVDLLDPLPLLNESDAQLSQALTELVGADPLAHYLVKDQIASRFVATIDSLTSRQVPPLINPVRPADEKFIADMDGETITMSTENFARYDGYLSVMQGVNSGALVSIYQRYYPLFQQAWEENGGEGSFNSRLLEVIDHVLTTPDVPGPVYLNKPEAVYVFEDPELEAMTAGQKLLVRMGSVNASLVKEKLAEIKAGIM